MAVVNQYKFVGKDNDTTGNALTVFATGKPGVNETIIIKSILVTLLSIETRSLFSIS